MEYPDLDYTDDELVYDNDALTTAGIDNLANGRFKSVLVNTRSANTAVTTILVRACIPFTRKDYGMDVCSYTKDET